jgi:hypothetical protein
MANKENELKKKKMLKAYRKHVEKSSNQRKKERKK